jgi:hypothetical protein
MLKRKRGRPRLTPEQKLERQKAKILKEKERAERRNKALESKKLISYVLTPAGKCPFTLHGSDEEAVVMWLSEFKTHSSTYKNHTVQSLTYWTRDFYSIFSEEYKEAKRYLISNGPEYGFPDLSAKLKLLYRKSKKEIKKEKTNEV